ncbi:MAG: hypothetical protein UT33_C0011G0038 [Candidatus Peregrinibacteria bacterium GW2011_GWC2_39_14]|nr:MAG: hypothetical protein UT33_C0011G0038 [Candidatus Peregrinibacteria bacterium GW2011_GWC2_39_14]
MNVRNTLVAGLGVLAGFGACSEVPKTPVEIAAICAQCDKSRDATRDSVIDAVDTAGVMPVRGKMAQEFIDTTSEIDRLTCLKKAGLPADACSK